MAQSIWQFVCTDLARVILAMALLVITGILLATGKSVPDVLWALDGAAIGWYFGGVGR